MLVRIPLPTLLLCVALLCIPAFILFERKEFTTWTSPLLLPAFEPTIARHTPRHATGTFLPPIIHQSRTLGPADNPVIITTATQVPAGVSLTLLPGTHLFFHEFASLTVAGNFQAQGTAQTPIQLHTNELHPTNQTWGGLLFTASGRGDIAYTTITDASPALSCLPQSHVAARVVTILRGSLGLFTASANCQVTASTINGARDGVVVVGAGLLPDASNDISARRTNVVRHSPSSQP